MAHSNLVPIAVADAADGELAVLAPRARLSLLETTLRAAPARRATETRTLIPFAVVVRGLR